MMFALLVALWYEPPSIPNSFGIVTSVESYRWKMDGTKGIKVKFSLPLPVIPDSLKITLFDSMCGWDFIRMDVVGQLYKHLGSQQSSQKWFLRCPNWPERIRPDGGELEFVAFAYRYVSKNDNLHDSMTLEYIEQWEPGEREKLVSEWVVLRAESERWSLKKILGQISSDRLSEIPGWCGHGPARSNKYETQFDVRINKGVPDRAAWEKKFRETPVWPYSVGKVEFVTHGSFEDSWNDWKKWYAQSAEHLKLLPLPIKEIDELLDKE